MNVTNDNTKKTKIISKLLTEAVQFWLRSQVQQVASFSLQIEGTDPEILRGVIPKVGIIANQAVYRDLHLTAAELTAQNIRFSLRHLLRGKPITLLEAIPITGEVMINQADLNSSLRSNLLAHALQDFLIPLWQQLHGTSYPINQLWPSQIYINFANLLLEGILLLDDQQKVSFSLELGLVLATPQKLRFVQPRILVKMLGIDQTLDTFEIDLGTDVSLTNLILDQGQIFCEGQIMVNP